VNRAADLEANKALVRRLVEEVVNQRNADPLDELAKGAFARLARRWISPFRSAFPDFRMEVVGLVAEGDTVVGHFKCSGTHQGEWLGVAATGRRFEDVDEIYVFQVENGKLRVRSGSRTTSRECGSCESGSEPSTAAASAQEDRQLRLAEAGRSAARRGPAQRRVSRYGRARAR
jgi:predicted ester cyclase